MKIIQRNGKTIGLIALGFALGVAFHWSLQSSGRYEGSATAKMAPTGAKSLIPLPREAVVAAGKPLDSANLTESGQANQAGEQSANSPAAQPVPFYNIPSPFGGGQSPAEGFMSKWAARDPEEAGKWLDQNRSHPQFADLVRGYAIQVSVVDPAAARQWAKLIRGKGERFSRGGTLEQHIDAVEDMLSRAEFGESKEHELLLPTAFLPDYDPVLVRQAPGEAPVLEMAPRSPFT